MTVQPARRATYQRPNLGREIDYRDVIVAFLVVIGIAAMAYWGLSILSEHDTLPPCATDEVGPEFPDCYWDAATRGNGHGTSFILVDGVASEVR